MTDDRNDVPPALACPRCGAADVDDLRLEDPAADDQDPDREIVVCEQCQLRYRLP